MKYEEIVGKTKNEIFDMMLERGEIKEAAQTSIVKRYKYLNPKRNFNLFKRCCERIGYNLDYETTYLQLQDGRIIVIIATAGSGKSTAISVKIAKEIALKGINPHKVCVLSFNKASVRDIEDKIRKAISGFNLETSRFDIAVDVTEMPNIRSLNSLTYHIVDQNAKKFGLHKVNIIKDSEAEMLMSSVCNNLSRDCNGAFVPTTELVSNMCSLYDLMNETLDNIAKFEKSSYIQGSGINLETAKRIMASYKAQLKIRGYLSHSDTCRMIIELAERDPEFKRELSEFFELTVVDEYQDVSEATATLIKLLVGDKNRLWVVGDGDQSIYRFKGSRPNNCQLLLQEFPEAVQCNLSLNRRCNEEILKMARVVLSSMSDRNALMPRSMKDGGVVRNIDYTSKKEVIENLGFRLSKLKKEELCEHAIGYRKNFSAFYIVNILLELDVPFIIKDDFSPGSDLLSTSLNGVMALLKTPSSLNYMASSMYKICGIPKNPPLSMINKVLHKNYKQSDLVNRNIIQNYLDEIMDIEDIEYFYEIPSKYLTVKNHAKVEETMEILEDLSDRLRGKEKLSSLVPKVFEVFSRNYWNYTRKLKKFPEELEMMILEDWCRNLTYTEYKILKGKQEDQIKKYADEGQGVFLYSMHSLKGLEFNNVHLVEIENNTMPLIRGDISYSEQEIEELINEELRLFYVAITRAKTNLEIYWSTTNMSPFYGMIDEFEKVSNNLKKELDIPADIDNMDLNLGLENSNTTYYDDSELALNIDLNDCIEHTNVEDENIDDISSTESIPDLNIEIEDAEVTSDFNLDIITATDDKDMVEIYSEINSEQNGNPNTNTNRDNYQFEDLTLEISVNSDKEILSDDLDLDINEVMSNSEIPDDLDLDITEELKAYTNTSTKNDISHEDVVNTNVTTEATNSGDYSELDEVKIQTETQNSSTLANKISKELFNETEAEIPETYIIDADDNSLETMTIDQALESYHPDEDFVEFKNGKELQGILNVIVKEIVI